MARIQAYEELESLGESDINLESSDDEATPDTLQRLRFQSPSVQSDATDTSSESRKWWHFRKPKTSYEPLSIQSGDIVSPNMDLASGEENHEQQHTTLNCFTSVKKFVATIFNCIMKCVFFHRRIPVIPLFMLAVNVGICICLLYAAVRIYPPVINISLRSFTIPTHPSQEHWDTFLAAKAQRYINSSTGNGVRQKREAGRRVVREADEACVDSPSISHQTLSMKTYPTWKLELVYQVPDSASDNNLLTKERLSTIYRIEQSIYNSEEYQSFCHKAHQDSPCDRLTSVISSLYPINSDGSFVYKTDDGFTPNLTASLLQFKENIEQAIWFTGNQITIVNTTNQIKAQLLRSEVIVGLPLPCFGYRNYGKQKEIVFEKFISLIPLLDGASTSEVEVLYGGTAVFDYQVNSAEIHDALLVIPSLVLILVVMFILTGFSLWLTLAGFYAVVSSFPWAFFVYRIVLGIDTIGILNIISLFVVIGIGVDDVFVFINTFKQTSRLKNMDNIHQRLGYTILTAGKSTLFTSLTTAVAFFANAISSIPAVKQFGIFMGLIVIFCYVQVLIILPLTLHIWHCAFMHCENIMYRPFAILYRRLTQRPISIALRMSALTDDDSDRRIPILGMGNGDETESSSTSSLDSTTSESSGGSFQTSNTTVSNTLTAQTTFTSSGNRDEAFRNVKPLPAAADLVESGRVIQSDPGKETPKGSGVTFLLQVLAFKYIAKPILFFHRGRIHSEQPRSRPAQSRLLRWLAGQTCVVVYVFALLVSIFSVGFRLGFTEHPPQLFGANTNIQKMLNLAGNLSDVGVLTCSKGCDGGLLPNVPPKSTSGNGNSVSTTKPPPSNLPVTTPSVLTTVPSLPITTPSVLTTVPTNVNPPVTTPSVLTTVPTNVNPPVTSTENVLVTTHSPGSTTSRPQTPPPTTPTGTSGGDPTVPPTDVSGGSEYNIFSSRVSNNIVVNVVFGLKGIVRKSNDSHVLPEGAEGDYAVQDDSFYGNFTCEAKPNKIDVTGSVRALCRICANISNPANKLVLEGNFNCFPASLKVFGCLLSIAGALPECQAILTRDMHNVSVYAESDVYYNPVGGSSSLRYLAMSFRSRSNPNDSPFKSLKDYQQWEEFLSAELDSIKHESGPGGRYEGAEHLLSSAFQTSEDWYKVNLEIIAIYGSLYGIIVSSLLCVLVIVFLTHNWRILLAILLTILNILVTMLGFFVAFGWTIGIVEAITLAIVVGNSLDYCIHLAEGYMTADSRHFAFVDQFKFLSGAPIRLKRVAASISFIGVSITSSAVTTIIAVIPLLATQIELFSRFGQILLLDTILAIVYTFVFCGTFLALFGPLDNKLSKWKVLNACLTIFTTIATYGGLVLLLFVLSKTGSPILTPQGDPLF